MIKIRFLKHSLPYGAGECAWFTEAQVAPLLKQKFAERVDDAGAYVPAPPRLARAQSPSEADRAGKADRARVSRSSPRSRRKPAAAEGNGRRDGGEGPCRVTTNSLESAMADKGDRVKVRFVKNSLPYTAGDEAWFNEIQAASFIKQGYATRVDGRAAYVPAPTRAQVMAEESARHRAAVAAAA